MGDEAEAVAMDGELAKVRECLTQSIAGWEGEKVSRPAPARAARGRAGRGIMGLAGPPALYWTHLGPI